MAEINGLHVVTGAGAERFETYPDVAAYLAKRVSSGWTVMKPFFPAVMGKVVAANGSQEVHLRSSSRVGVVALGEGPDDVVAAVHAPNHFDLHAPLRHSESGLLYGGVARVIVQDQHQARLHLRVVPEHEFNAAEIAIQLRDAELDAQALVDKILS
jgi:hypothetical protein